MARSSNERQRHAETRPELSQTQATFLQTQSNRETLDICCPFQVEVKQSILCSVRDVQCSWYFPTGSSCSLLTSLRTWLIFSIPWRHFVTCSSSCCCAATIVLIIDSNACFSDLRNVTSIRLDYSFYCTALFPSPSSSSRASNLSSARSYHAQTAAAAAEGVGVRVMTIDI